MPTAFDHIALATRRIADAPTFLVGELGGISGFGGPSGDFRWWHWDFDGGGRIEVIEADGPPGGFVHRYLQLRGPGIHHVNMEIESLRDTCDRAEALGQTVVGYDDSHEYWRQAFLHPKGAMGIVVQLVESTHHDHDGEWEHPRLAEPAAPANPPQAVSIVGLRMRSADRAAALRQWGELLGGETDERQDDLIFRWPSSPMRVAVSIEPDAENEAVAIEVRAERSLTLPSGPHPELGTQFWQVDTSG